MDMKDDAAVRAVGAYGGGIASSGNVCGILLGGIAMISSIYSRASLDEKEDPRIWAPEQKVHAGVRKTDGILRRHQLS